MKKLFSVFSFVKKRYRLFSAQKYSTLSGTLVYFFLTSVLPFSFWLSLLFGDKIFRQIGELSELRLLRTFLPVFEFLRQNSSLATGKVGIVLLLSTLYSSTNLFYHVRRIGEILYRAEHTKRAWKLRLSACALLFVVLLAFAVFSGAVWLLHRVCLRFLPPTIRYLPLCCLLGGAALVVCLFLNAYVCPYRFPVRSFFYGSAFTCLLWGISVFAFFVYLRFADFSRLYGRVSSVVIFFLFSYLMANCFLVGVILNGERLKGEPKTPKKY